MQNLQNFTNQPQNFISLKNLKRSFSIFAYNYCLTKMLQEQLVKLEEIKDFSCSEKECLTGPFKLVRQQVSELERFEKQAEWTPLENAKYGAFIELNAEKMEGKNHGSLWGVYKEMGKFVSSRNYRQCKSQHQKLVREYNTIPDIISALMKKFPTLKPVLAKQRESLISRMKSQQNENNQTITYSFPTEKPDDKDMAPTDAVYQPEEFNFGGKGDIKFNAFPSLTPAVFMGEYHREDVVYGEYNQANESEWRQCHGLFAEWYSRVSKLCKPAPFRF